MIKRITLILIITLIIIVTVSVILYWRTNIVDDFIQNIINQNLAETVQIEYESLSGDLFRNVTLTNVTATLKDGSIFKSNYVKVNYSLYATASQEYLFNSVFFDSLYVYLNLPPDTLSELPAQQDGATSFESLLDRWANSSYYDTLFASLPEIYIGRLKILQGKLEVPTRDLTLDSIIIDLNAQINKESFELKVDNISAKWIEKDFTLNQLHFQLLGKPDRITLNQVRLNTPFSYVYANGEIDISENLRMILNLEDIQLDMYELNTIFAIKEIDSGLIHISSQFVGSPNKFSAQIFANGFLNEYKLDSLVFDGDYHEGEIILNRGKILANESEILVTAEILKEINKTKFQFTNLNLTRLIPDAIETNLTGRLYLEMEKLDFKNITGIGEMVFNNSSIDSMEFDSLVFAITAIKNNFKIIEPSFLKLGSQSRFAVKGGLSRENQIDLNLYTENNSLESLSHALHLDSLAGIFDGNLFLTGDLFNPDLEGYIWIPGLIKDQLVIDSLILQIKLEGIVDQRQGDAFFSVSHGKYGPMEFTETRTDLIFDGNTITIDTLLFANGANYFSSSGYLSFYNDTLDLGIDFFRIFYENYWIENNGQILFRSDSIELSIEQAEFKAPDNGILELRGLWDKQTQDMEFGIFVKNIYLDPFNQFLDTEVEFSGVLEGDIQIANLLSNIELDMEVHGEYLTFNNIPFGNINCALHYRDNDIYLTEFNMSHEKSKLEIDGDVAIQLGTENEQKDFDFLGQSAADLKINWQDINLQNYSPLFKLSQPIRGKTSGYIKLSGSMTNPSGIIEIGANELTYNKFYSDSLTIMGRFNRDSLLLEHIFADLNGTAFEGNGWQLIQMDLTSLDTLITSRPFELNIRTKDDSLEFIGFLTDQVERLSGPFEIDLQFNGSLNNPSLSHGFFKVSDGILELSRVRNPLVNVEIDAEIQNSVMNFQTFSAEAAKDKDFWESTIGIFKRLIRLLGGRTQAEGTIEIDGTIDFTNLIHPKIDLNLDLYKLYIDYFVENTDMILSSSGLNISGRDTLTITGNLDIDEGNYMVDVAKLQKNIYLSQATVQKGRAMAWNIDVSMPGNFMIRSSKLDLINNFQFEISGNIRTVQKPFAQNMELTGYMDIMSGKYGSWGQDFEIQTGNINFTDPNKINPDINIIAEKRSRDYLFELSITGNLEKQVIDLQVRDGDGNILNYSDSDKLTLLTLGTRTSRLQASDLAKAGGDVLTTSVETAFGRGAESITGLDKVELDLNESVVDLESMKLNNGLSDASISFGKYLTSNLYLEYRSKLGEGTIPVPKLTWVPGNQIFLEYRFNKNWSLDSFYQQTQRGNNMVKLSVSWKTTF